MSNYISCDHCGTTTILYHVTPHGWERREVVGETEVGDTGMVIVHVCPDCVKKEKRLMIQSPRDALIDALDVKLPDWVDEIGYQADTLADYLWHRVATPDVISLATGALYDQYERNGGVDKECAIAALEAGLSALIGPRPGGKEGGNE